MIGNDAGLLRAMATAPERGRAIGWPSSRLADPLRAAGGDRRGRAGDRALRARRLQRSGRRSAASARCEPADRSPVILRALGYERTVSIESAGDRLVVRAALPLADPALRLLGAVVVSVPVDGLVADRLKAALGAGRDVIIYRGGEPEHVDVHGRHRRAAGRAAACRARC